MQFYNRWSPLAIAGVTLAVAFPIASHSADTAKAAMKTDADSAIDPAATAALDKMGKALRTLKEFSIQSDTTMEVVLDSGQKIQLGGSATWKVKQPNDLYVEVKSDRHQREFYYNGKDLTIYSPRLKFFTSVDGINANLRDFVLRASSDYGIELPLTDLFFWGTEYVSKDAIKGAMDVGPATLDDDKVEQYAFRQQGVDWQVWISDATSLPRKLVITSLDDPARPQYSASLTWNTSTTFPASTFDFAVPEGTTRIKFTPATVSIEEEE